MESARTVCRAALAKDPYREELHQAIIAYLIRTGGRAEAAAQYRRLSELLHEEFDFDPSPETRALFETMQGDVDAGRIRRTARTPAAPEGPYVCDARTFDAIHSVALRMQTRHGLPIGSSR